MTNEAYDWMKRQNPYASTVSMFDGSTARVAPTIGGVVNALNWQDNQVARQNAFERALGSSASSGGGSGGGAWSPSFGTPSSQVGANQSPGNPYSLLKNVKNQGIADAAAGLLGKVNGLGDWRQNTGVVKTNTKSTAQQDRINSAGNRFDADVNNAAQSFSDFTKNWMAGQGQADATAQTQADALNNAFDTSGNGLQARLNAIAAAQAVGTTQDANRAMQNAMVRNNASRVVAGDSSYLDAMLNNQVGAIAQQAAARKADQDRNNILTVLAAQQANAGRGQQLLDAATMRRLYPTQVQQQISANQLAQLGQLGNMDLANNFYTLDTPEQALARQLGLLGSLSQIDLANTFYGVQKPYEPNTAGYAVNGGGRRPQHSPQQDDPYDPYQNPGGYPEAPFGNPNRGTPPVTTPLDMTPPTQNDLNNALRNYLQDPAIRRDWEDAYGPLPGATAQAGAQNTNPGRLFFPAGGLNAPYPDPWQNWGQTPAQYSTPNITNGFGDFPFTQGPGADAYFNPNNYPSNPNSWMDWNGDWPTDYNNPPWYQVPQG